MSGGEGSKADKPKLTLDRIYNSQEFQASGFSAKWLEWGTGYTVLEDASGEGRNIVHYELSSEEGTVLVAGSRLSTAWKNDPTCDRRVCVF